MKGKTKTLQQAVSELLPIYRADAHNIAGLRNAAMQSSEGWFLTTTSLDALVLPAPDNRAQWERHEQFMRGLVLLICDDRSCTRDFEFNQRLQELGRLVLEAVGEGLDSAVLSVIQKAA